MIIPVTSAVAISEHPFVAAFIRTLNRNTDFLKCMSVFARPDNPVYDLAVTGNRICTVALFFIGFNIFSSGMFTYLLCISLRKAIISEFSPYLTRYWQLTALKKNMITFSSDKNCFIHYKHFLNTHIFFCILKT